MSPPIGSARAGLVSQVDAIPDSVEYQYLAKNFASPWPDEIVSVGPSDMTVSGLSASTFPNGETSVSSDGTDDNGLTSGPTDYISKLSFGLAFTFEVSSGDEGEVFGYYANPQQFTVKTNGTDAVGPITLQLTDDSDNRLRVYTNSSFANGNEHLCVINKSGNSPSDIDIYVDDITTPQSQSTGIDSGFDNTNVTVPSGKTGFFARRRIDTDSFDQYAAMDAGIFEFNSEPYSQSERDSLKTRRPEV